MRTTLFIRDAPRHRSSLFTPPPSASTLAFSLLAPRPRQGLALLELGDFSGARLSLRDAAAHAPAEGDRRGVREALRRLQASSLADAS